MNKVTGIYAIRNMVGNKAYVGSSVDVAHRVRSHRAKLQRGVHANAHLQSAWDKYGETAFRFEVLMVCPANDRLTIEQALLDRSLNSGLLYNWATNAIAPMSGKTHSPETRQAIGAASIGVPRSEEVRKKISASHKGKKKSAEHRANIGAVQRGKQLSPEHRARIAAALVGRERPADVVARVANANRGKKRSFESRAKMSAAGKGRQISPEQRAKISAGLRRAYAEGRRGRVKSK